MTAALLMAAAMSVFTDDFATNQTLAEHWQADGEIRSEEGHLVVAPGAKATWRGSVPEKYVLTWVEGEERRARREECTSSEKPKVVFIAGARAHHRRCRRVASGGRKRIAEPDRELRVRV